MEHRFLGKSGMQVSNICLGTMTFGMVKEAPILPASGCDEYLSMSLIDKYVELGGNFIDTADMYSHTKSESIIGQWLESRSNVRSRDDLVIATKCRMPMGPGVNNVGLSRRHITNSIDRSLERLKTSYIDLYQTHIWDEAVTCEETLRTLDDLVRCGKVRYVGGCNLTGWQLQKIVETSKNLGLNPYVSLQQQYSLLCRWSELEAFQVCKQEGLGVMPWSPLKGGLLSGKYKRNVKPEEGRMGWVAQKETRGSQIAPAWSSLDDATFDVLEAAERIGKAKGKTTAQVAVRWLLQKDVVSSVIIGVTKESQLVDNMQASSGWSLSQDEMKELDELSKVEVPYPYEMISRLNQNRKNSFSVPQQVANKL